jgi:glutathionyl-hydroquinone reductase
MGMLVKGTWSEERIQNQDGRFVRPQSQFRDTITADGSSEFKPEAGRYHLYVAYSCPWAHRTIIFRKLKGLEDIISMAVAVPGARGQGWTFDDSFPGSTTDSTNEFRFLHQAYTAARPDYTGTVTVPTLWDRKRRTIVNNESSEIIRMFNSAFDCVGARAGDYYPPPLRPEIDRVNELVYDRINNGVYRTGFASDTASVRRGGGAGLRRTRYRRAALVRASLPGRRRDNGSGLAAVRDAGALRCGLL